MKDLSDKQIQAQVSVLRRITKNEARHFAIRATNQAPGSGHLLVDGVEHLLFPCISDLEVREALLKAEAENKPSVLLCGMGDGTLGDDVVGRLAKRRIFSPQLREMVAELFAVSPLRVDPRVLKSRVLMEALLDEVPGEGYPPVANGTLDLETAWLTLLSQWVGERVQAPSLTRVLEWSRSAETLGRLGTMDTELKSAFVDWFARAKGESIRFMIAALDGGFGADLLALGAVLGVVFDPDHSKTAEHQTARGRLERYFQHREIDEESARAWFRAAGSILLQIKDTEGLARRPILNRLDELLTHLGMANHAWLSVHSPLGLEQRYEQAGRALLRALTSKDSVGMDEVFGALTAVRRHSLSESDPERVSRVEMACRLIRWLRTSEERPTAQPFDAMVIGYHREGGFIDWARNRLKEMDESLEVRNAFAAILKQVEARTGAVEAAFAVRLQEWSRTENQSDRFVLIENVLQEIVLPVAKAKPTLLLVLDGMSVAVFRQLLQDVLRQDWSEVVHAGAALPRPVLATLPSVTSISRRALFLGRLDPATNGTEEGEFKANDLLFHGSGSQVRPQLFKMGALTDEESGGGVAPGVRHAIADKKCRVVAVVLNAIDDHLDSGKQVDIVWTRNTIRGFRDLLRQAADAGRWVILTSDHGHVLDFGTEQLPSSKDGRGDRFRTAEGNLKEGELAFEGSRIYKATGCNRITLACSATVRYGKDKRGYHGGANPQELVVPLAILSDARADTPEGWSEVPPFQPDWWQIDTPERVRPPVAKPKPEKVVAGLELFEQASGTAVAGLNPWIDALLRSPTYKEQTKLAVRGAPADDLMIKLLNGLDTRGGTAVRQALAQDLGMPPLRVDGLILNVSRILNVDGYEVIRFDRGSDTVTLNLGLLRAQFDLGAPA